MVKENKERLIEDIGVNFEKIHQFSPLAARLYAILILCPNTGYSFSDLVKLTKASKSSVSTNLNLLLENGSVEYFTKSGDRKRYFRSRRDYLKITLERHLYETKTELDIINKVSSYNKQFNKQKYQKNKKFGKLYKRFLENISANLQDTLHKMNQLEQEV